MEVPARELAPRLQRVDLGRRHRPDGRLPRALPPDQDRAGRRAVSQRVGVHAEPTPCLAVGHPAAGEVGVQPSGRVLRPPPPLRIVRQPPEREGREIARRDHVDLVARAPQLNERRVLPARRVGPLDPGVDRQERGPRHAVLQARPRRLPQRAPPGREPLVERADPPSEGQDLRSGQREAGPHRHINRPSRRSLRPRSGSLGGPAPPPPRACRPACDPRTPPPGPPRSPAGSRPGSRRRRS